MNLAPFHLAIPVNDLPANRHFYTNILELEEGRSSDHWVDYNFFGHQLVIHLDEDHKGPVTANHVDGKSVPVPHYGIVLEWDSFRRSSQNVSQIKGLNLSLNLTCDLPDKLASKRPCSLKILQVTPLSLRASRIEVSYSLSKLL
jgi:extradiol dioxygenase family protein